MSAKRGPFIVAIGNDKGGVGKSSLAVNVAGVLAREGRRVVLIDADRNESASEWAVSANLEDELPAFTVVLSQAELLPDVRKIAADVVVIDLPGARGEDLSQLMKPGAVDLFVLPSRASVMDLEVPARGLLSEIRSPLAVVLTFTNAHSAGTVAAFREWLQAQGIDVMRTEIRQYKAWADAREDRRLLLDQPRASNAKADLLALVAEIKERMK